MRHTATIDYKGVPLVCDFDHYRGFAGNRIDPPEPETCEIYTVKAGAVEITPVFTEDQLFELGDACLEWVHAEREFQESEHADMLREERALGNA